MQNVLQKNGFNWIQTVSVKINIDSSVLCSYLANQITEVALKSHGSTTAIKIDTRSLSIILRVFAAFCQIKDWLVDIH